MNDCNLLNADFAPANLCGPGSCDWGNMKLDHVYFTCGTAQNVQEQCCADERNPDEVTTYRLLLSRLRIFDTSLKNQQNIYIYPPPLPLSLLITNYSVSFL